jgi:CspA family cold shock protein
MIKMPRSYQLMIRQLYKFILSSPIIFNFNNIMKKGKVKFFNTTKGFGFINDNESGKDVFVHSSGLKDSIRDGDDVTFEIEQGKKGLNAVNVMRAS